MLINKRIKIILFLIIFPFIIFGLLKIEKKKKYPLFNVKKGKFLIDFLTEGTIHASNSTYINTPMRVWGNIRIIKLAEEGKYVNEGDFLIQFDTLEFKERVQNNENELEKSKAAYESQVANIEKSKAEMESQLKIEEYSLEQTKLNAKNAKYEAENKRREIEYSLKKAEISYNQLIEKIENTKEINKATLRQAELKVHQAEISLQRAKDDMARLTINSPCGGLVVYKKIWTSSGKKEKIKIGSTPWPGLALMEIPDKSHMKVILNVNEVNISSLKLNQPVNIAVDALPEQKFTGKIVNIANLAHDDEISGKKVFEIEVKVNELSEGLKPGMSTDCQIIIENIENVISIPIDAITKKDEEIGVYNSRGKFVPIKTGKASSDLIIVEQGLKEGDSIRLIKTPKSNKSTRKKTETPNI